MANKNLVFARIKPFLGRLCHRKRPHLSRPLGGGELSPPPPPSWSVNVSSSGVASSEAAVPAAASALYIYYVL